MAIVTTANIVLTIHQALFALHVWISSVNAQNTPYNVSLMIIPYFPDMKSETEVREIAGDHTPCK